MSTINQVAVPGCVHSLVTEVVDRETGNISLRVIYRPASDDWRFYESGAIHVHKHLNHNGEIVVELSVQP
jgi:hypothetical protein